MKACIECGMLSTHSVMITYIVGAMFVLWLGENSYWSIKYQLVVRTMSYICTDGLASSISLWINAFILTTKYNQLFLDYFYCMPNDASTALTGQYTIDHSKYMIIW